MTAVTFSCRSLTADAHEQPLSKALRITAVVLGILALVAGALSFAGVPGFGSLGTIGGGGALAAGGALIGLGLALRLITPSKATEGLADLLEPQSWSDACREVQQSMEAEERARASQREANEQRLRAEYNAAFSKEQALSDRSTPDALAIQREKTALFKQWIQAQALIAPDEEPLSRTAIPERPTHFPEAAWNAIPDWIKPYLTHDTINPGARVYLPIACTWKNMYEHALDCNHPLTVRLLSVYSPTQERMYALSIPLQLTYKDAGIDPVDVALLFSIDTNGVFQPLHEHIQGPPQSQIKFMGKQIVPSTLIKSIRTRVREGIQGYSPIHEQHNAPLLPDLSFNPGHFAGASWALPRLLEGWGVDLVDAVIHPGSGLPRTQPNGFITCQLQPRSVSTQVMLDTRPVQPNARQS